MGDLWSMLVVELQGDCSLTLFSTFNGTFGAATANHSRVKDDVCGHDDERYRRKASANTINLSFIYRL